MRYERFFQYTKGWHQVNLSDEASRHRGFSMMEWCHRNGSDRGFHVVYGPEIERVVAAIRFQSAEDAMLFALEWS